jgi:hypothetical protein
MRKMRRSRRRKKAKGKIEICFTHGALKKYMIT